MLVPTAGVIAMLWIGVVEDIGALLVVEHVVMLPRMLVRRDEYWGAREHGSSGRPLTAWGPDVDLNLSHALGGRG